MLACLDVDYRPDHAAAACLVFDGWLSPHEREAHVAVVRDVAPYEPGAFYRRELPCLLAALALLSSPPDIVIVDGYVWLDASLRPGLGAHLFEALGRTTPVVGVAKTAFAQAAPVEVLRGSSKHPLYVTSVGLPVHEAAQHVRSMHGPHRVPSLLKKVDRLCRDHRLAA